MDTMSFEAIALREACVALDQQAKLVKQAVLDSKKDLWCTLPTYEGVTEEQWPHLELTQPNDEIWSALASQLTNIWMGDKDDVQHHGILVCGLDQVNEEIARFNDIKQQLIEASDVVKAFIYGERVKQTNPNASHDYMQNLAVARSEFLTKSRDREFHALVRSFNVSEINFRRARKLVRVLQDDVAKISYTWSKTHYRKRALSKDVLETLALHFEQSGNEHRADEIRQGLANNGFSKLYKLSFSKPTLRINYRYFDADQGKNDWGSCLASGIVVVQQENIPLIGWKPEPSTEEINAAKVAWLGQANLKPFELASHMELYRDDAKQTA